MERRNRWQRLLDSPMAEWALFAAGVLLVIGGMLLAPLPGPGGIFLIVPGLALILKSSMWAKRRYVTFKRWQPKVARWTDKALRRPSARRREALEKAQARTAGN